MYQGSIELKRSTSRFHFLCKLYYLSWYIFLNIKLASLNHTGISKSKAYKPGDYRAEEISLYLAMYRYSIVYLFPEFVCLYNSPSYSYLRRFTGKGSFEPRKYQYIYSMYYQENTGLRRSTCTFHFPGTSKVYCITSVGIV